MGCVSSKQKRCPHCQHPTTKRSYSMHDHQPLPELHSDSYHLVAFSSSTLGSLKIENIHFDNKIHGDGDGGDGHGHGHEHVHLHGESNGYGVGETKNGLSMGLIEAKTWSNLINNKIPKIVPKTPIRTPPGEPENINVWEVMEGLDDVSPFRSTNRPRSFSFDIGRTPISDSVHQAISEFQGTENSTSPKPFWQKSTDLDPEVITSFRKSLEELPPDDPFHLQSPEYEKPAETVAAGDPFLEKDKVVVYFTSLRGVRKTYEDCCEVRVILKAIGARADERDLSMDSGFKQELKELLGEGFNRGGLPKVFIGKNFIGGADEIRRLHEDGQLEKLLGGGGGGGDGENGGCCEVCGDVRFVPCETCSGSCKIYYGEEENEREKDEAEEEYGFQRCPDCNENGLVRCPICCS